MQSPDKVLVIAVNGSGPGAPPGSGGPPTLALPAPLPSEVKYSASLVRGLGWTHLCLGLVLFILGILGTWAEPETSWSGTGIWGGLVAMTCGFTGLIAHKLWYKNFAIKAFLVTSVCAVLISLLAVGITLYSIINREERFLRLLEEAKKNPWFASLSPETHHRPTLNVSINQVVGFVLELLLAMWSTKVAWRGARAVEFSSSQREAMMASQQEKQLQLYQHYQQQYAASAAAAGPQIPLAALYQLLQAHPELLGVKAGMNNSGWVEDLEKQRTSSMDYHERVDRYLANTLDDNRPPSTLHNDSLDHSASTASTSGESSSDNGGRGSPSNSAAETVVCTNNSQNLSTRSFRKMASVESLGEPAANIRRSKQNKKETKSKAPNPSTTSKLEKENTNKMEIPPKDNNSQKYDAVKKSVPTQDNKDKIKTKKNQESDSNKENMERGIKIKPSDIKKALVVEDLDFTEQVSNLIQEKPHHVSTLKKENQHISVSNKVLKENSKNSEKILDNKDIKHEMFEKRDENSECANIMPSDNKHKITHIDAKPTAEIEADSLEAINDKLTEQNSSIIGQQRGDTILEDKNSSTENSLSDIQPPSQFCDN